MSSTFDSPSGPVPRKTDFFKTFLDTLGGSDLVQSSGPSSGTRSVVPGFVAAVGVGPVAGAVASDPLDAIMRALDARGGTAAVKDLVDAAGNSLGGLLAMIQTLQNFGLVSTDGATVRLTADGSDAARKLG